MFIHFLVQILDMFQTIKSEQNLAKKTSKIFTPADSCTEWCMEFPLAGIPYTIRWRHRLVYAIPANGNSIHHSEPESSDNCLCCKWQSSWKCFKQPKPKKTYKQKQQKKQAAIAALVSHIVIIAYLVILAYIVMTTHT